MEPQVQTEIKTQRIGTWIAMIFGLVLFVMGGRMIAYQYLLENPTKVVGVIVNSGKTHKSSGGDVSYIDYQFVDQSGNSHTGTSSRYSGTKGTSVLIEYSQRFPSVHRVAGEGNSNSYKWRWFIAGTGLFFLIAGLRWRKSIQGM